MTIGNDERRVFRSLAQVAIVVLIFMGLQMLHKHLTAEKKQKAAELDLICTMAAAKPYQHFETTLACLRWSPIKSDIPLPGQGSPAY